jgi:hypothetical protein
MATYFVKTAPGISGRGGASADYVAGNDKYSDKKEVKHVVDKNLPKWAKDGKDFFSKADVLERANGRPLRSLIVAIPREAKDPLAWSKALVDDVLKDKHAYRMAIHDSGDGNPHLHLIFCERGRNNENNVDDPKAYFTRKNPKLLPNSLKESAQWLANVKDVYLKHVQTVAPDFVPKMLDEIKIGPKLKGAGRGYEEARKAREEDVNKMRYAREAIEMLDKQIEQAREELKQQTQQKKPVEASRSPYKPLEAPKPSTLSKLTCKAFRTMKTCGKPPVKPSNAAVSKAKAVVAQHMPAIATMLEAVAGNESINRTAVGGSAAKAAVEGLLIGLAGVCQRIEDSEKITQQYKAFTLRYDAENGTRNTLSQRQTDRTLELVNIVKRHEIEQSRPKPQPAPRPSLKSPKPSFTR